ncbi:MAG: DNA starvation/stationary phase protection protein [Ginsengibacter sp.]
MNSIGLEKATAKTLSAKMNDLLSCYMVFYQNVRGFHWNIKGEKFFELHAKYEGVYNSLLEKVDEIAERILTLDGIPLHSCDDYRTVSKIKGVKNVSSATEGVSSVLESFKTILPMEREILKLAAEAGDEGTVALMSGYISEQEKEEWMYSAYLNN